MEPHFLGEQAHAGAARDVFFATQPSRTALAAFLSLRDRAARATLVLVPPHEALDPELATRYAPGAHVELVVLADALVVKGGAIVLAPRLRLVRALPVRAPAPADEPRPTPTHSARSLRSRLPPYSAWSDFLFRLADGHTLLVSVGRAVVRVSYFDLRLDHKTTREPLLGWKILRAIYEGHGAWDWKAFGDKDTVPQLVSELQKTLMAAFDLAEKPFERLSRRHGYRPKFRAAPGSGASSPDEDQSWK